MVHKIYKQQLVNASMDEVWQFFSSAANLQTITPPDMKFKVTSGDLPKEVYPGQIITYKVSPLFNVPLYWMTEIMHVVPGKMFVDEQRKGPYAMWHHQHHFEETENGVLMTDIVHFELPLGILGEIAYILFVKEQLRSIFRYRTKKVAELFDKPKG